MTASGVDDQHGRQEQVSAGKAGKKFVRRRITPEDLSKEKGSSFKSSCAMLMEAELAKAAEGGRSGREEYLEGQNVAARQMEGQDSEDRHDAWARLNRQEEPTKERKIRKPVTVINWFSDEPGVGNLDPFSDS